MQACRRARFIQNSKRREGEGAAATTFKVRLLLLLFLSVLKGEEDFVSLTRFNSRIMKPDDAPVPSSTPPDQLYHVFCMCVSVCVCVIA